MWLNILTLAPGIALVWWLSTRVRARALPSPPLVRLFLGGMLATQLALVLNHALEKYTQFWPGASDVWQRLGFWWLGPGLNEELAKLLVLFFFAARRTPHIVQGLLAATTVACGFAVIENLIYLDRYGSATLIPRSVFSLPAHITFTAFLGYGVSRFQTSASGLRRYAWLLLPFCLAAGLHGSYNVLLFLREPEGIRNLSYVQVLLAMILWWRVWQRQEVRPAPHAVRGDA